MSKKNSPFAALTAREQQERWMEFQSIQLPYMRGDVDGAAESKKEPVATPKAETVTAAQTPPTRPAPIPAPAPLQTSQWQKPHHRQYDAVMKKMVEAGKQTSGFQPVP